MENPSYRRAQGDLEDAERELHRRQDEQSRDERDVDRYTDQVMREGDSPNSSTGSEQNLSRARSSLERSRDQVDRARDAVQRASNALRDTAPTIEEDVYSDLEYTVTTHRRVAQLPVRITVLSEGRQAPLESSFVAETFASDEEHAAYPIADISADPLDLPSDNALLDELEASASASALALAEQAFELHRRAVLDQGFTQSEEGKRLHFYVVYMLMHPELVDERVLQEIHTARGIPDASRVILQSSATSLP